MIIVDSSALIAIFQKEADAALYALAIHEADRLLISAVNAHETGIVMRGRHGIQAGDRVWRFLQVDNDFDIVPFDEIQAREAFRAFSLYGKGVNPKAKLNLADCAAYALAKSMDAPLLFKGNDFSETDVKSVVMINL